ncbi:MAG: DNA-protecting protein DprA [Oscillospiraceae bacterium]|nr:DNA-protecting protein DprA [Oscillospiraceae bacterium]
MKVAIIGSRGLQISNLEEYLPEDVTEIISGGAKGIDTCAKIYALENNISYTEYLPEYAKYGKRAALIRNRQIVDRADLVLAFWDGISGGTAYTIKYAKSIGVRISVYIRNR